MEVTKQDVDHALMLARQYRRRFAPRADRSDCESAALEGLFQASRRYRPEQGDFWVFATSRVIGAIKDEFRTLDYLTRREREHVEYLGDGTLAWRGDDDTFPTMLVSPRRPLSIEQLAYDADEDSAHLRIGGEDGGFDRVEWEQTVYEALEALPERERFVVVCIDLEGYSGEKVGEFLGVTGGRVSQIRAKALSRMRAHLGARLPGRPAAVLAAREAFGASG